MTGPEHYRTAQDHLSDAAKCGDFPADERTHLHYAAVHAQLALAAATALGSDQHCPDYLRWKDAASVEQAGEEESG